MGSQSLVAALQLQLLRLIGVVLEAAALLPARFRPTHIVDYVHGVSISCRRSFNLRTGADKPRPYIA